MRDALTLVKRELGEDAVILGTRNCPRGRMGGLIGRTGVEITATPPDATSAPRGRGLASGARSAPAVPDDVCLYYQLLVRNEVAEQLAARLAHEAGRLARRMGVGDSPEALRRLLCHTIARSVPVTGGIDLSRGVPRRVALVGPAGSGKTTTLAKLAAHFKLRCKKRVGVLSLDVLRTTSNEQLRRYGEIIGVPMHAAQTLVGVKNALTALGESELMLIDTHGVSAADRGHFARLVALLRAARPDEIHLVLPASMSPSVQVRMARRYRALGVCKVILTHLDEAVGLGVILNAIDRLEWGLSYVTDGGTVPNHIEEACAERIAALVFPPAK